MGRHPEITRRLDRASEAVVLAIVVLAPWAFGAVEAWAGFLIAGAILVLSVIGAVAGWFDRSPETSGLRHATPGFALAALALLALAQATPRPRDGSTPSPAVRVVGDPGPGISITPTIAQDREAAITVACWLALAWAFFLGVFRLNSGRRLAASIAINSAALALFALIQALGWNGKIYWLRESPQDHAWFAGGPFVCHNHLAAYLNLGLGFALGFLLEPGRRERGQGLGWAYVAGVVGVGVIGSQSRGGTVAMLTALAAVFVVPARKLAFRGLAAIGMSALFLLALGGGAAMTRLATVLDTGNRGYAVRFEVWRAGLRAWLEHPALGAGLGSFATAAAPHFLHDRGVVFTHAENEFIHLLTEGGLVAIAITGIGVVALAVVARRALAEGRERPLVLGAIFGLLALAIQSLGDFAPHIPAVGLTAVACAAMLTRLGRGSAWNVTSPRAGEVGRFLGRVRGPRDPRASIANQAVLGPLTPPLARRPSPARGQGETSKRTHDSTLARGTDPEPRASRSCSRLVELATVGAALLALTQMRSLARAEAALAGSGVPFAGPAISAGDAPTKAELQRMATALERALVHRPDWCEGHLRLGATRMALYQAMVSEWIAREDADMADPLWLVGLVHEGKVRVADLTSYEPIARHLIPAARSFLEARRANPASAPAHVGLASLHDLMEGLEPVETLLNRARELAGTDSATLTQIAAIAARRDDVDEASRCWRLILAARDEGWEDVADAAGSVLSPGQIRDAVAISGRNLVRFAEHLYADDREARDLLMTAALERLPAEIDISTAERMSLEAHALATLGQQGRARQRMERALALEPARETWREELIGWLVEQGDARAAQRHARLGAQLSPDHMAFRQTLDQTAEALARGSSTALQPDAGGEATGTSVRPRTP